VPSAIPSVFLDSVASTNTAALEMAAAGEPGPLWVVARRQTEGRGRNGRRWASAEGNLYASLLLRPACPFAAIPQLSLVAGVAVVEAITAALAERAISITGLRLKWPNDVLIGSAKCAGILPESRSAVPGEGAIAVIGIGVNLATHPRDLERAATDLAAHGLTLLPTQMLHPLNTAMARWLGLWDGGAGFAGVRAAWLRLAGARGERLMVSAAGEQIAGTFEDLDAGGALVVRERSGGLRTVSFGDVTLAAPTAQEPSALPRTTKGRD
jgi:BirA family transcriptional regulator, biotin operon repressor / biotin---[acetyl-CoA-carboxylase] ligase